MKVNKKDNYFTTEDPMVIEDGDTGEQQIFLIDRENRVVIRSLLEDDIKNFISNYDSITSKQKRDKMRLLYKVLPHKDSQYYFFAVEQIIGKESKRWDSIYGLPRVPMGICIRFIQTENRLTTQKEEGIEAYLYEKYTDKLISVSKMIEQLAQSFGIEGNLKFLNQAFI